MSWPRLALRYRYAIFAALIAIVVFGVDARLSLPVKLFPNTDPPVVTVITAYPGMAAVDVAKSLSKPLEEEFAGVDGVRKITSTSQTGLSVVKAEFHYGRNTGEAALDVQNAIARKRNALPAGIGEPQVLEFSSSDKPILTIALGAKGTPLTLVRELADNEIRDRLQLVEGVAAVDVFGAHIRQLEIVASRAKLEAYGLSLGAVSEKLAGWNLSEPGGRVRRGGQEAVVRLDSPITGPVDAADIVVGRGGESLIRLKDVARAEFSEKEARSAYRFNGNAAIAIQVLKRDEANTVEVASKAREALDELRKEYPGIDFTIADDDSVFTELVISNMTATVMTAIVLTIFVVLLFITNVRQALIISISIPVAFLMTFILMQAYGIDLNMITMSAIILSIGLLVDDSIVVVENVNRLMRLGKPPTAAAIEGAEEIFMAKLGGTATTIAVLVPMMFLGGFVGKLFEPLAKTLTFALLSSFFISMTLIPLLTALWLRPDDEEGGRLAAIVRPFSDFMDALRGRYLAALGWATRNPVKTMVIALFLLAVSARLMVALGSEMLPKFDSGSFQVIMDTAPGTPIEDTVASVMEVEKSLLKEDSVVAVSSVIGYEPGGHYLGSRGAMDVNQAEITVNLTSRKEREETVWEVMDRIRDRLANLPGVTLGVVKEKGGTARASTAAPLDVRISGPDPETLDRLAKETLGRLKLIPGVANLYTSWSLDTPEINVKLDRDLVAGLGLDGVKVARSIYSAMEGGAAARFRRESRRDMDIYVRYAEEDRRYEGDLRDVSFNTPGGGSLPLRALADLETRLGPRTVTRENFQSTVDVLGYHYGRPLSETVGDVAASVRDIEVPPGYSLAIGGEQTDFVEARSRMLRALVIGIVAVYLALLVQFRSFKHPLTVLMAVPFQFIGVSLALLVAGKYLSMPALLGVILLTGTVVNNSIILVDYILARLGHGAGMEEAIVESVSARFRPIMMTALSDVAGMLPLALELAVGAERFSPIATVVIGGILAATFLTLIFIPAIFVALERLFPSPVAEKLR